MLHAKSRQAAPRLLSGLLLDAFAMHMPHLIDCSTDFFVLSAEGQLGVSHQWRQHRKHVFILSNAGKPIWTLHGDENALAGLMAVIQALVSFVHDKGDSMQSIR